MQFLQEVKQPKPYYSAMHKKIGSFNINDGLVDITDPCYNCDQNAWYAMFGYRTKPGKYNCYVNIANFPSKVKYDEDDSTDINAIRCNKISITPVTFEMTHKSIMADLEKAFCKDGVCSWGEITELKNKL